MSERECVRCAALCLLAMGTAECGVWGVGTGCCKLWVNPALEEAVGCCCCCYHSKGPGAIAPTSALKIPGGDRPSFRHLREGKINCVLPMVHD